MRDLSKYRVAMLLSGGVDSSVALAAIKSKNPQLVEAFYLKIWLEDDWQELGHCPWEEDLVFARQVCEQLGVNLHIVPLQQEYRESVMAYTLRELKKGATPSPDIFCNQWVKFGSFMKRVGDGFDYVATGHYARVEHLESLSRLHRAADSFKDQTYFLSRLSQAQLRKSLFPLGELTKDEVRQKAREYGFLTQDRPDSQGLCFLGKFRFDHFVAANLGKDPGEIIDISSGRVLGQHQGLWFHTVGQRKGLGLSGGPWFVVDKDLLKKRVFVCHADDIEKYADCKSFLAAEAHYITSDARERVLGSGIQCKLRHGERLYECKVSRVGGTAADDAIDMVLRIDLSVDDKGIAAGQFVVFYEGTECLGSARIGGRLVE